MRIKIDSSTLTKILLIIVFVFALDQITKWIAFTYLQPLISVKVIGNFFRLTYVENPGMAFGIRINNRYIFNFLSISAALVLIAYLLFLYPYKKKFTYSLALILGGAFGNLFDRLVHGKVIDFLDFDFFNIHIPSFKLLFWQFPGYSMERWPVFNLADVAVSTGMILIILIVFFTDDKKKESITTTEPVEESGTI